MRFQFDWQTGMGHRFLVAWRSARDSQMAFDPSKLSLAAILSPTSYRQLPAPLAKSADEFSAYVGRAIWASNYCHAAFARLFAVVATPESLSAGIAMWHTLDSDAKQRHRRSWRTKIAMASLTENRLRSRRHRCWSWRLYRKDWRRCWCWDCCPLEKRLWCSLTRKRSNDLQIFLVSSHPLTSLL